MTQITLSFQRPHVNQRRIIDSPARFVVAACGRRFGKSEAGKRWIVMRALYGKKCWWVSPTYAMATEVWRDIKTILRPLNCEVREADREILLPTGGYIAVRSGHNYDNLRGVGLDSAVLDEAAFMHPDVWPAVVRPMLLERQGSARFLSTPYGRNHFWQMYMLGLDELEPDWQSFHFTSYDNPMIDGAEIDAIQRSTPERIFAEEYLAEFRDDAGGVFRGVADVSTAPLSEPYAGHFVMGADWGKSGDFTALSVIDVDRRVQVDIDRFNNISWALQQGRLTAMYHKWRPTVIYAEENSFGSPNIERLQSEGLPIIPFTTSNTTKRPLIENLALAIERQDVTLLNDPVQIAELQSYEMQRLPSGTWRYSAPLGMHDDTVIALALAWHGVAGGHMLRVDTAPSLLADWRG